ncbi:MAG: enoyl-CoA hydratase-related protein [Thermodesulfobacteriota bacterium]|nr:enoyl-CoA hydratase-related protein [Thermodesulfobacteriota bacterium]
MEYKNILFEKNERIAKITINRPHVKNAMDGPTFSELYSAFKEVQEDEDIGVAILTGAGNTFSAGADIKFLAKLKESGAQDLDVDLDDIFEIVEKIEKPVIAAVNGYCIAGAFELILTCDIIIAAENAIIGDTHARLGLVMSGGGTQRLPRLVGALKAKEMFFTCDLLNAIEAERIGLVNQVVAPDKLEEATFEMARKIVGNSIPAIGVLKSCINRGMEVDLATGLKLEKELAAAFTYPDREERMRAFAQRKKS